MLTGLELAEVYQQSYVHVTGHNRVWGCESNGIRVCTGVVSTGSKGIKQC